MAFSASPTALPCLHHLSSSIASPPPPKFLLSAHASASRSPFLPLNCSKLPDRGLGYSPWIDGTSVRSSFGFRLAAAAAATSDDQRGEDPPNGVLEEDVSMADKTATAVEDAVDVAAALKQGLIDSLYGTDRGLNASSETRAEIVESITQLEARNPTPAPTEALALLDGKWILVYTSFSELFPLLAAGTLPLVKVGEISQTIDSNAFTVQNSVTFTGPLATTSFSASASFEVLSPKRVQIKFEEGVIGTPQLTDSIEIPQNVNFLGQNIDLTPFQGLMKSLQNAASSVARTISGRPPLKFPINTDKAQSWLLTTYLDDNLRISRGDGGSVFVLVKEGSPFLK
eukprot:c23129_g2_i1 orf=131-1156(+)